VAATVAERRETARQITGRLAAAKGPTALILPRRGIQEWDRPGEALHDAEGLAALVEELRVSVKLPVSLVELDAHINDPEFAEAALQLFDAWVRDGLVPAAVGSTQGRS
jgi:uncharacterized protein (UPF0261 family)